MIDGCDDRTALNVKLRTCRVILFYYKISRCNLILFLLILHRLRDGDGDCYFCEAESHHFV